MEMNKKREVELQRLRRELEESSAQAETMAAALRKRHGDALTEMSEQCEGLQRTRAKLEKEKQNLLLEVDDLAASLDTMQKGKASTDMQLKKLEDLLSEANSRNEDLQKALTEVTVAKNRLTADNNEMSRQIEETETKFSQTSRSKS
ncbi:myosin heavy chain, fast skeletal muscle, partial [Silurus asotus]